MQLQVGLLPPRGILESVAEVVRACESERAQPAPAPSRRGLLKRLGGGRAGEAPPPPAPPLDLVPADQAYVPIASFGNLTRPESMRLVEALAAAAAQCPAPRLSVGGLAETVLDGEVALALGGDVDGLTQLARGITRSVERLGLFVDRRRFRPALLVATASAGADAESLARVTAALSEHAAQAWAVEHLSLLQMGYDLGAARLEEVEQLALATG